MPRPSKGPRLYLRRRQGRPAVWEIRGLGEDISTGCAVDDRAGAERQLEAELARRHRPGLSSRPAEVEVADVLTLYARDVAPKVKRPDVLLYTVETLGRWWSGKVVSQIKGAACREYVAWRAGQKWAHAKTSERSVGPSTARRELETLRAAIRHYHAEIGLDAVPTVSLPEKAQARERFLTRTEAARLLRAALREPKARHLCRFILIGIYTGTRHDAMLRLGWAQNTLGGWLDVDKGLIYRRAQGARETKKRQPPARLPNRLLAHLRRWRAIDAARGRNLVIHHHGEPIAKIRRSWATARTQASAWEGTARTSRAPVVLGEDVVPHTMRHTAATWMMQGGVDPWLAAGVLGMTVEVLENTYGHHHPDFQKGIANAF